MAINKLLDSNSLNAIKTYVDEKTDGVSKTYTGLYTVGTDNWANANFYFIKVRPVTWQTEWSIRYRLECDLDSGLTPTDYQYMLVAYTVPMLILIILTTHLVELSVIMLLQ